MDDDGVVFVEDDDGARVLFQPRAVMLPDGDHIAHESLGGELSSVRAVEHGEFFLEIAHLGDGPIGGELVMTITSSEDPDVHFVAVGDLWADDLPAKVPPTWPVAVDLALGLLTPHTILIGPEISKDELEELHQRLLGVLHG